MHERERGYTMQASEDDLLPATIRYAVNCCSYLVGYRNHAFRLLYIDL